MKCTQWRLNNDEPGGCSEDESDYSSASNPHDDEDENEEGSDSGGAELDEDEPAGTFPGTMSGMTLRGNSNGNRVGGVTPSNTSTAGGGLSTITNGNGNGRGPYSGNSTADSSGGGKFAKVKAVQKPVSYAAVEKENEAKRTKKAAAKAGKNDLDDLQVVDSEDDD
jgi:hypothetical protein